MKKDIEVDKSLFKRVSSTKKASKLSIPKRVAEVNKHQHNADFVASQKRTSNTKGKESELAADWQRFSDADAINVADSNSQSIGKSSAHPTASLKSKVDKLSPAQRAQLEAHKLAQKNLSSTSIDSASEDQNSPVAKAKLDGLRPSSSAEADLETTNFEGSKQAVVGQADLGGHVPQGAGQADLGDHVPQGAGQADMGEHIDGSAGVAKLKGEQLAGVGQADMGHHVDGQAGIAALKSELLAEVTQVDMGDHLPADAMQADMGDHTGRSAGIANLTGKSDPETDDSLVSLDTVEALKTAPAVDLNDTKANEESEESGLSGRLAEKMSKIRTKTDDITTEIENLTEQKDPL